MKFQPPICDFTEIRQPYLGLPVICGKCLTPSEAEQYVREPPDKQGLAQAVWALFMCIDCDPCALAAAMYGPDFVGWACV